MGNGRGYDQPSFLSYMPNLQITPPEDLRSATVFEEFNARLMSEDGRINNLSKIRECLALCDELYKTETVVFHWNFACLVEMTPKTQDRKIWNEHFDSSS